MVKVNGGLVGFNLCGVKGRVYSHVPGRSGSLDARGDDGFEGRFEGVFESRRGVGAAAVGWRRDGRPDENGSLGQGLEAEARSGQDRSRKLLTAGGLEREGAGNGDGDAGRELERLGLGEQT